MEEIEKARLGTGPPAAEVHRWQRIEGSGDAVRVSSSRRGDDFDVAQHDVVKLVVAVSGGAKGARQGPWPPYARCYS